MNTDDKLFTLYLAFTQGVLIAAGGVFLLMTIPNIMRSPGVIVSLSVWTALGVSMMVAAVGAVLVVKRREKSKMHVFGNIRKEWKQ